MKRTLLAALLASALASPVQAAITVSGNGTTAATSGTNNNTGISNGMVSMHSRTLTLAPACPNTSLVVVGASGITAATTDAIVMSNSNSQTMLDGGHGTVHYNSTDRFTDIQWFQATASITTITVADTSTVGTLFPEAGFTVLCVAGFNTSTPEDSSVFATSLDISTTVQTNTITSGTPSQSGDVMFVMSQQHENSVIATGCTETSGGFTNVYRNADTDKCGGWSSDTASGAFLITVDSSTHTRVLTTSPSGGTVPDLFGAEIVGFKAAAGGGGATVHNLAATGAGK